MVAAAVIILLVNVVTARADVMPPEMRSSVNLYQKELHAEWIEWLTDLNGPYGEEVVASAHTHVIRVVEPPSDVERWRSLVGAYFQPEHVDEALLVMWCESRGNPDAKNSVSTASGLFQMLKGWWGGGYGSSAVPVFDPFDPQLNVRYASVVFYAHSPEWRDWRASRHCHGL